MKTYRVGILGATGMVGQRLITLLEGHPWFEIVSVAASSRSAGQTYGALMKDRWAMGSSIPATLENMMVKDAVADIELIASEVDFVFCGLSLDADEVRELEERYASLGCGVVSTNSAHRWTEDVPMIIPEVNPEHVSLIDIQRKRRGWDTGFIAVKSNCSIQSYVPLLTPLRTYGPLEVHVAMYQAISGAGKTFETWPEIVDNIVPHIGGEEEKSEQEPQKIWANLGSSGLEMSSDVQISAQCLRVPVLDGHMAAVWFRPSKKIEITDIRKAWEDFNTHNPLKNLDLPSAPAPCIIYHEEPNRPQTGLDRDTSGGMAIHAGRLRTDEVHGGFRFIGLSHNTLRGAAGGAVLMAELLAKKGIVTALSH